MICFINIKSNDNQLTDIKFNVNQLISIKFLTFFINVYIYYH